MYCELATNCRVNASINSRYIHFCITFIKTQNVAYFNNNINVFRRCIIKQFNTLLIKKCSKFFVFLKIEQTNV